MKENKEDSKKDELLKEVGKTIEMFLALEELMKEGEKKDEQ